MALPLPPRKKRNFNKVVADNYKRVLIRSAPYPSPTNLELQHAGKVFGEVWFSSVVKVTNIYKNQLNLDTCTQLQEKGKAMIQTFFNKWSFDRRKMKRKRWPK